MSGETLTSFAELAGILERLPHLLVDARRSRRLSLRAAAEELPGVSFNTLYRVEHGGQCDLDHAIVILRWLDQRPEAPRG